MHTEGTHGRESDGRKHVLLRNFSLFVSRKHFLTPALLGSLKDMFCLFVPTSFITSVISRIVACLHISEMSSQTLCKGDAHVSTPRLWFRCRSSTINSGRRVNSRLLVQSRHYGIRQAYHFSQPTERGKENVE